MKNSLCYIIILLCPFLVSGQHVEVIGKLKVSEMDTFNTEENLVVKRPDGTLALRMLATLPPPPQDTSRTLQSDLVLTSALCNCENLPPAMIQSLLDNGYSVPDLVGFRVPTPDLLEGGISFQVLLDAGVSPIDLYTNGIPADSLFGNMFQGGLIFYLDTMNLYPSFEGLVSAPFDQSTGATWGCFTQFIGGTSTAVGTGQSNTTLIVTGCGDSGIAARICDDLVYEGQEDWFLPSEDELNLMWEILADSDGDGSNSGPDDPNNLGDFENNFYWSSSENDEFFSSSQYFGNGAQTPDTKVNTFYVRAVRAF